MAWSNIALDQLMTVTLAANLKSGTPVKVTGQVDNSVVVDAGGGDAYCGVLLIGGKEGDVRCVVVRPGEDHQVIVDQPVTKHQLLMESGGKFCPRAADAKAFAMALEALEVGSALITARLVRHCRINTAPGPLPVADQNLAVPRGVEITPLTIPPSIGGQGTLEYFVRDLPEGLSFDDGTRTISGAVSTGVNAGVTDAWIVSIDEYGQVSETKLSVAVV